MSSASTRFPDPPALEELVRRIVDVAARPDHPLRLGGAGDMGPDSEIDVLVVKSGVEHRRRLAQDIYMNLSGVGVGVDIIVLTPDLLLTESRVERRESSGRS